MTKTFKYDINDPVYFIRFIGWGERTPANTKILKGTVSKIEINIYWTSYQMDYTEFDMPTISMMQKEEEVFKTKKEAEDYTLSIFLEEMNK